MKHFPRIGMRIIKTSIAVFVSISIYIILLLVDNALGYPHDVWQAPSNMYTPFFAGIAAVYSLHKDKKSSFIQAKTRTVASVLGGYFGMIIIMIAEYILINHLNLEQTNFVLYKLITFVIVSLGIIPLIVITVKLKQKPAVFITCLTYLSVTISIRNGGMPVFQFATNRILSTLVGAFISLGINNFSLIRSRNKDILFVSSLDNNFISNDGEIDPFVKYELNTLYYNQMPLTFVTTRTLTSLETFFDDIDVTFPMIVMNGSARYYFQTKQYDDVVYIKNDIRLFIEEELKKAKLQSFTYTVYDNIMRAYHSKLINEGEKEYYSERQKGKTFSFVRGTLPLDLDPTLYVIVDRKDKISRFVHSVNKSIYKNEVDLVVYQYTVINQTEYYYLKINSHKATKKSKIDKLVQEGSYQKLVVCGSGRTDLPLIRQADLSICLNKAPTYIKSEVDIVLPTADPAKVLKLFDRIFKSHNPDKVIKKFKSKYQKQSS